MKTFKSRIKSSLAPCYLVNGEDLFLYDKAVAMLEKAMNLCLPDFNKAVFDDDNFNMQTIVNACEFMPMGSDRRLVIIKNIAKLNENDGKILAEYLKNPCKTTILMILDYNNQFLAFKTSCEFVDAKRMDRTLAKNIIVAELAKNGKQISSEAAETLLDYCNGYLTFAMNELDKLIYFDTSDSLVTKKLIENVVHKNIEFAVFQLTEALGKKNLDKAIVLLNQMEKQPGTLALITNHFRRLFFIAISDMTNSELASLLSVREYAISKQREQVNNFSKMQLKKIYALLEDIDYKIKSGEMLSTTALYYLVFSILYI